MALVTFEISEGSGQGFQLTEVLGGQYSGYDKLVERAYAQVKVRLQAHSALAETIRDPVPDSAQPNP